MPKTCAVSPNTHPAQVTSSRAGVASQLVMAKSLSFLGLPISLHSFPFNRISSALRYACRWEGRPRTPPFQWGAAGEVLPPHDQWLRDFDGSAWGLDKLVEPALLQQNPNFLDRDLQETRDVLLQWAGALQAIFTIYQLQVWFVFVSCDRPTVQGIIRCFLAYYLTSDMMITLPRPRFYPMRSHAALVCRCDACARDIVWFQATPTARYLDHHDSGVYSLPPLPCISHTKTQAPSFCQLLEMHLHMSLSSKSSLLGVTLGRTYMTQGKTGITTIKWIWILNECLDK